MGTTRAFDHVGRAIRLLRGRAGLTQGNLAETAGVTKSQISKYERGRQRPNLDTLERILGALGVGVYGLATALDEVEQAVGRRREIGAGRAERAVAERARARRELVRGLETYLERLEATLGRGAREGS